jgi:hypothetical protein
VISGFFLLGILYFFLEIQPPAHYPASAHILSEISLSMCVRDLGAASCAPPSPFHPTGIWLFRSEFTPPIGLLIPYNPLVR